MAKIKIKDIPQGTKISKQDMKNVTGGWGLAEMWGNPLSFGSVRPVAGCGCMGMSQDPVTHQAAGCGCMGMSQDPVTGTQMAGCGCMGMSQDPVTSMR